MITGLRVILGFIATIVFIAIVFSSFFTTPKYLSIPDLSLNTGSQEISNISLHSISMFDSLYSNIQGDSLTLSSSGGVSDVSVNSAGKYLSSFRDVGEVYTYSGTGFLITQEGSGEIYIDSETTPGKVFVYTITTPATLSLVSEDGKEKYVDIHLTPHMYIEFQANRGKYLKNVDRIRVGTVFKLGYVGALGEYGEGEEYMRRYFESPDNFFTSTTQRLNESDMHLQKLLTDFSTQSVSQIPGYESIQRYIHFFVNKEKKIVFYKNTVLEGYLKLLHSQSGDTNTLAQVKDDLSVLKTLDMGAYDDLLELQDTIMRALYASDREEYIIPKILFTTFENDTETIEGTLDFPMYGFSLFHSYDTSQKFSQEISQKFLKSFSVFADHLSMNESQKELRYDYFSYYLEKQLLYLLQGESSFQDISSIIMTLENYVNIRMRNDDYSVTSKISRLYVISQVLGKIDYFLRSEYFAPERTIDGLLKTKNKINLTDVIRFQKSVNALYDIYDRDKKHLKSQNTRDAGIIKDIGNSRKKIGEYFSALEDYETYKTLYDVSKTNLLGLDTFSSGENNTLGVDKIQKYLSQFTGISFNEALISIKDDTYYHVEKLNISGKLFSFDISGFPEYKMTNIYVDDVAKPIQYKLGKVQDDWAEEYKTASENERDAYDFSRFFFLTFFVRNEQKVEEYISQTSVQEDKTERVFKKDILLGNPGEFTSVSSFLDIEYSDIKLEKDGQNYRIFLDDVDFNIVIPKSSIGDSKNKGVLKSEYVLNSSDHYFKGASIQIQKNSGTTNPEILFDGKSIFIGGKIHISDIKNVLEKILQQSNFYNDIYGELNVIGNTENLTLQYMLFNDKLSIKFDSFGKKYTILVRSGNIESIYAGSSKITSGNISPEELKNYIK